MRKTLLKIDASLALLENFLIIVILGIMVLLSFLQVVLRNFFDTGLLWGDIFLRHLVLWVGFIGASLATRQDKHINIDIFNRIISKKFVPPVKFVVNLFSLIICIILAKASYQFMIMEKEAGTILFNNVHSWIIEIILPGGFSLIALRFVLKLSEQVTDRFSRLPGEAKDA
jgi:C4-dicarboxylate transporter DctQ subunit